MSDSFENSPGDHSVDNYSFFEDSFEDKTQKTEWFSDITSDNE